MLNSLIDGVSMLTLALNEQLNLLTKENYTMRVVASTAKMKKNKTQKFGTITKRME